MHLAGWLVGPSDRSRGASNDKLQLVHGYYHSSIFEMKIGQLTAMMIVIISRFRGSLGLYQSSISSKSLRYIAPLIDSTFGAVITRDISHEKHNYVNSPKRMAMSSYSSNNEDSNRVVPSILSSPSVSVANRNLHRPMKVMGELSRFELQIVYCSAWFLIPTEWWYA